MEICQNLWQVGGDGFTNPEDAAIYLIRFGDKAVLIDAGCGGGHGHLVNNISAILPPEVEIVYLLLTHCHYDHTGGAAAVREHYGCKITAHHLDAGYLEKGDSIVTAASWYGAVMKPFRIDHKITGRSEIITIGSGDIEAHHCPGHSPGSMVFVAKLDGRKVLFGQDVHGPLDPSFFSNRDDYRQSLQFILDLNADILCEGHFGVYEGAKRVKSFIQSYL